MAKIEVARRRGRTIDGHAPGLTGSAARRYAEAGIDNDHECATREEAEDKLAAGMHLIIREGSAAKNFDALHPLIDHFPGQIMFCTDDLHPDDLVAGHIDRVAARAIQAVMIALMFYARPVSIRYSTTGCRSVSCESATAWMPLR